MPANTVRLSEELARRVALAAERAGTTPDEFVSQTLTEKMAQDDWERQFNADADQRYAAFLRNGLSIPWTDVSHYLQQRLAGEMPAAPRARKFRP